MKLTTNNINRTYINKRQQSEVFKDKFPQKCNNNLNNNSTLTFGAKMPDVSSAVSKTRDFFVGNTIKLTEKQLETIENTIADKDLAESLRRFGEKTGFEYKQAGFIKDLVSTLKYPFKDMWLDIASFFVKNPKKDGIIQKHIQNVNNQKLNQNILDIVSQYNPNKPEDFANVVARNLAKSSRNYKSRDERTLNRMLTSTVSAIYSANDFYNISMLRKDNKEEAQKAQKSRFKQEMSRMALSAGLTFITMGALDKHIKNNMVLSAISIAASALISEIGSRLISKTPIGPLTPEKAKEYAQKKNTNDKTKQQQEQNSVQKPANAATPFKGTVNNAVLFKDFAQKDGSFASLNILKELNRDTDTTSNTENKSEPKQKNKLKSALKIVGGAIAGAGLLYFSGKTKVGKKASGLFKKIEDNLIKKTEVIKGDELANFKKYIDSIDSEELQPVINRYRELLNGNSAKNIMPTNEIKLKSNRFLITGFYNGFTKIFKTLYTIFSAPAKGLEWGYNKITHKPAQDKIAKDLDKRAIAQLYKIYNKNKDKTTNKVDTAKVVEELKKKTGNFEFEMETGDLANFSRTLVTAISTYFFVNDYRNKVLIESNGQDTEGAAAEVKQRLGHKLANFIINGTIMNVGNSLFKTQLNKNLIGAGMVAIAEETTNEALVRKSTCQPIRKKQSKEEIIEFEQEQLNKKGLMGAWSRLFRKATGKKTLTEKAGVNKTEPAENKEEKEKIK